MNNFVASKNSQQATCRKQRKQRVSKKYKEPRKTRAKVKKVLKHGQELLDSCAENESSFGEIYNTKRRIYNPPSEDSVIYMGPYFPENGSLQTIPLIDLTNSTESLLGKENVDPMQLRTLYFPERNFKRSGRLCKSFKTTSLITLPVPKMAQVPEKPISFTDLNASALFRNKLSILDLPDKFFSGSCSLSSPEALEKAKLTSSDYEMINWIIENDQVRHPLDAVETSSTSENVSLDTGMSIEELVKVYDVPNMDGFE